MIVITRSHPFFGWKAKKRSANAIQQCFQTRILPYLALTTEPRMSLEAPEMMFVAQKSRLFARYRVHILQGEMIEIEFLSTKIHRQFRREIEAPSYHSHYHYIIDILGTGWKTSTATYIPRLTRTNIWKR